MIEALYLAMTMSMPMQAAAVFVSLPTVDETRVSILSRNSGDVLLLPSASTRGRARAGESLDVRQDEWIGNDKLRHFLMSMAVTQFAYGGLRTADMEDDLALPIAIGVAAATGVGKELHDVRNEGPFSLKDLAWDAAGIIAAGLLLGSVR